MQKKNPLKHWLGPAWPDEAREIIQTPIFERMSADSPFQGRCLNAGCGEGLYCSFLESFEDVTEIMNVDVSDTSSIPKKRNDPRHRSAVQSLTSLTFSDSEFDCCLCTEVIEHIEDDSQAISELARVVKRGGLFIFSVPTPPAPFNPGHVREGYTINEFRRLLEKNGIHLDTYEYCFFQPMRLLRRLWHAQYSLLGKNRFPRILLRLLAHMDRALTVGKPWDLVVRAENYRSESGRMRE